jgi:hypothetical protein
MIQASELRIGNLALTPRRLIVSIDTITDNCFCALNKGSVRWYSKLNPIPLTEEWLIRFGLMDKPYYKAFHIGSMEFDIPSMIGGCLDNELGLDEENSIHIQSVHQLQNLYFALTGEELKLNEI